jgi:hypothetical protein
MKNKRHRHEDVTPERLERARAAIAYAMTLDGAVYGSIFERLEREIAARRMATTLWRAPSDALRITPRPLRLRSASERSAEDT